MKHRYYYDKDLDFELELARLKRLHRKRLIWRSILIFLGINICAYALIGLYTIYAWIENDINGIW